MDYLAFFLLGIVLGVIGVIAVAFYNESQNH